MYINFLMKCLKEHIGVGIIFMMRLTNDIKNPIILLFVYLHMLLPSLLFQIQSHGAIFGMYLLPSNKGKPIDPWMQRG